MFGKFSEQVQKSSKPMASLFNLNAKAIEAATQKQTQFFTGVMADSVKYVEALAVQTEAKGLFAAQSNYAEAVKERVAHASKDAFGMINELRDQYTVVMKASLEDAEAAGKEFAKAAQANMQQTAAQVKQVAEQTVAPLAATQAAVKPVAKPATKRATAKPAAKKPVAKKPAPKTATKPAVKKPAAKSAVAKPAAKPAAPAASKPVAKEKPVAVAIAKPATDNKA